jgi:hypothetical protein
MLHNIVIVMMFVLCFFIRAYPRIKLKNVYASDTYFHLYCAKVIRDNKFKIPQTLPRILLPHKYTYPYLYHYILARFSESVRLIVERFTGATSDTLILIVSYIYTKVIIDEGAYALSFTDHLLIGILFSLSPALLRIGSGPRAYNGTPRTVGQFLYVVHAFSYYAYLKNHSSIELLTCIVSGSLIILTGKFSTQVMLFVGIGFSLFISSTYVYIFAGSFLLSIILSNNKSLRILKGQLEHTILYAKYFQSVFLYPHVRTFNEYRKSFVIMWNQSTKKEFIEWFLVNERYPVHLLITVFPHLVITLVLILGIDKLTAFDKYLFIWIAGGLIMFVATKIRLLLFLGEGERYLEYSVYPSLYLFVKYSLVYAPYAVILITIYYLYCAHIYITSFISKFSNQDINYKATAKCFGVLNTLPPGIIWPIGSFHFQSLVKSAGHEVLTHGANVEKKTMEDFNFIYENYPYPSGQFNEIISHYSVSYIISDEAHIQHYKKRFMKNPNDFDDNTEVLAGSPILKIWKVNKKIKV